MAANGIVREALGDLGARLDRWSTTPWWTTDPEGPAFEAARGALKAGFGEEAAMVGAGGTIGFVQPFADLLEGTPCILGERDALDHPPLRRARATAAAVARPQERDLHESG